MSNFVTDTELLANVDRIEWYKGYPLTPEGALARLRAAGLSVTLVTVEVLDREGTLVS